MTMFDIYVLLALIVIGMALLLIVSTYFTNKKKNDKPPVIGTIVIETSDPDGPFLFLDLEVPVEKIGLLQEVVCKVDTNGVVGKESE